MKIFIDTNILLDLILNREFCNEALLILNAIEQKRFQATVLDISILNIDYIAKKQTKDLIPFLTTINNLFEVVGGSNLSVAKALKINNQDLEDNLQYISAKESKCKVIVTNDKNFYQGNLEIISSRNFIDKYL